VIALRLTLTKSGGSLLVAPVHAAAALDQKPIKRSTSRTCSNSFPSVPLLETVPVVEGPQDEQPPVLCPGCRGSVNSASLRPPMVASSEIQVPDPLSRLPFQPAEHEEGDPSADLGRL